MNFINKKLLFLLIIVFIIGTFFISGENTKSIIAQGSGVTKEKALINALKNAVRQAVGTFIDSETVVKNKQLIKNKVLMYSDGYVKNYKEIDAEKDDGFWTVTIEGTVAIHDLKKKIAALGIGSVNVDNKGLFAEGFTRIDKQKKGMNLVTDLFKDFNNKAWDIFVSEPEIIDTNPDNNNVTIKFLLKIKFNKNFIKNLLKIFNIIAIRKPITIKNKYNVNGMTIIFNNKKNHFLFEHHIAKGILKKWKRTNGAIINFLNKDSISLLTKRKKFSRELFIHNFYSLNGSSTYKLVCRADYELSMPFTYKISLDVIKKIKKINAYLIRRK